MSQMPSSPNNQADVQPAPQQTDPSHEDERSRLQRITEKVGDVVTRGLLNSQVNQSTLEINASERRLPRAIKTIERMDHKDALYNRLGSMALGEVPQQEPRDVTPKPRTIFERVADRRIDSRAKKLQEKETRITLTRMQDMGQNLGKEPKRVRRNSERLIRKKGRREGKTAAEIRYEIAMDRTKPQRGKDIARRKSERDYKHSFDKTKRAANQPILTNWRELRRKNANWRAKRNQKILVRSRQQLQDNLHAKSEWQNEKN